MRLKIGKSLDWNLHLGTVAEKLRQPGFFNSINKFWLGVWVEILSII